MKIFWRNMMLTNRFGVFSVFTHAAGLLKPLYDYYTENSCPWAFPKREWHHILYFLLSAITTDTHIAMTLTQKWYR